MFSADPVVAMRLEFESEILAAGLDDAPAILKTLLYTRDSVHEAVVLFVLTFGHRLAELTIPRLLKILSNDLASIPGPLITHLVL